MSTNSREEPIGKTHGGDYCSRELFHMVGRARPYDDHANFKKLLRVIASGWISHPPNFPLRFRSEQFTVDEEGNPFNAGLIVPEVTCFADIPIAHLHFHARKYGRFGVGLDRTYLAKYGARPVIYMPFDPNDRGALVDGAGSIRRCRDVYVGLRRAIRDRPGGTSDLDDAATNAERLMMRDVLAFTKPFDYTLNPDHPDSYYMEREWRRLGPIEIRQREVASIVVAPGFEAAAREKLPKFSHCVQAMPSPDA